ncbi:MAG: helix-turn-helix domain-containing protein [Actinomycetota bacterium]|jgi:cytoskeleton protein RodZ
MSVGLRLKEVRKSAGLTIEQLSARTRIPASVIEDLERDNFNTCGGPTYARGHIRTIARICGVGDTEILLAFESQTIPLSKSIRDLLNDTSATPTKKERKPLSWKALGGVAAGIFAFVLVGVGILSSGNNSSTTITSPTSSSSNEESPVAKKIDGVEVQLNGVNGLSWVAISDSTGTTLFSGRIRQGEERTFTDNQLLYVVIGNAGAINLTVNGEDIGVPGRVGEVVRLEFGPQASNQG